MPAAKRQMHLGDFVLGTGNHSAGWRYRGASTSNASLPVLQSIARIAERGKFDLFFISDSLAMDAGTMGWSGFRWYRMRPETWSMRTAERADRASGSFSARDTVSGGPAKRDTAGQRAAQKRRAMKR